MGCSNLPESTGGGCWQGLSADLLQFSARICRWSWWLQVSSRGSRWRQELEADYKNLQAELMIRVEYVFAAVCCLQVEARAADGWRSKEARFGFKSVWRRLVGGGWSFLLQVALRGRVLSGGVDGVRGGGLITEAACTDVNEAGCVEVSNIYRLDLISLSCYHRVLEWSRCSQVSWTSWLL